MDLRQITQRVQSDLQYISEFTATPGNGCTRMPFTQETRYTAEYLKKIMAEAGLEVWEDCVGNVFGRRPGRDRSLPCIMVGSHYDSVYNGGDYDGIAGVISAVELARLLQNENRQLPCDFVAAAFMDEEGCRFGTGYFGSKCMLGQMTVEECRHYTDKDNISVYDAMKEYDLIPEELIRAAWPEGSIGHYIELHIEQGPVLDANKTELGLVNCIVGIQRYMVTVQGRSDHAGTTPMDMRQDAVEIATKVISKIGDMAREEDLGTVATVGHIKVTPSAMNVVAETAEFSIDVRAADKRVIDRIVSRIREELDRETQKTGASYVIDNKLTIDPVKLSPRMLDFMEESCRENGFSCQRMPSGAGHDALAIGQSIDTVRLFVPSKDGRSHCPAEYTPYEAFSKGIAVLYDLIGKLTE